MSQDYFMATRPVPSNKNIATFSAGDAHGDRLTPSLPDPFSQSFSIMIHAEISGYPDRMQVCSGQSQLALSDNHRTPCLVGMINIRTHLS